MHPPPKKTSWMVLHTVDDKDIPVLEAIKLYSKTKLK